MKRVGEHQIILKINDWNFGIRLVWWCWSSVNLQFYFFNCIWEVCYGIVHKNIRCYLYVGDKQIGRRM